MLFRSVVAVQMKDGRRFRWPITSEQATCQRCGAPIGWVRTHKEKFVPVDPVEKDVRGEEPFHRCHFDTCEKQPART